VQVLLKGGGKGQELSLREAGRGVYARAHHLEYKWDGHTCIHFNSIYIYIYINNYTLSFLPIPVPIPNHVQRPKGNIRGENWSGSQG
jgi:hypothetical protein